MAKEVTDEDMEYGYNFVRYVCTEIGPGYPCTAKEQERAEYIKQEMEQIVDTVEKEEFTCSPGTHLRWFKLGAVLGATSAVFYTLSVNGVFPLASAIIATAIAGFIWSITFFQFILYKEYVDFLYKKDKSSNIVGKIRSKGPPKSIIIFAGHHDSSLQFTWLRYLKSGYFIAIAILFSTVVLLLVSSLLQLLLVIANQALNSLPVLLMVLLWILIPVIVVLGFFFTEKGENGGKVPGAIDNLSAVATSLALARILKRHPKLIPDNTEIRIVSFGCEEAGCRGSLRYVQTHLDELKKHDTACLNFESLYDPIIWIFKTDRNSTLRYSKEFVDEMVQAAEQSGVPFKVERFPFGGGGTDGLRFAEAGIPSTTLYSLRVPKDMVAFYHQEFDDYDKINKETLGNAMKIVVEFLRNRAE